MRASYNKNALNVSVIKCFFQPYIINDVLKILPLFLYINNKNIDFIKRPKQILNSNKIHPASCINKSKN